MRKRTTGIGPTLLLVSTAIACSEGETVGGDALLGQGKTIYQNICIACHDADPTRDGSLGPAVAGSSRELLEARVIRGEYPSGYAPKRPSQTMPKFEYLADGIDALAAYLATFEGTGEKAGS